MIILTDGDHELKLTPVPCQNSNTARYTSQYTAYGYVSENRLGSLSVAGAQDELENRFDEVCTNIKAAGITIYTIGFGLGPLPTDDVAIKADLQACASDPVDNFFNAPTGADLETAFRAIGAQLVNLRVAQ